MNEWIGKCATLAMGMILLPVFYYLGIVLCRDSFVEEQNRERKPLRSVPEWIVLLTAEIAVVRVWFLLDCPDVRVMSFELLYVMLAGMTVFCMTDYWERIVPNKLLLIMLLLFGILIGLQGVWNTKELFRMIPYIITGLCFSVLSFGLGYILSHGNLGAGDVKLVLMMGLYLTGEYVVAAVFYGCLISAAYSVVQLMRKKLSRSDKIPLVPFLYVGMIIRYLIW